MLSCECMQMPFEHDQGSRSSLRYFVAWGNRQFGSPLHSTCRSWMDWLLNTNSRKVSSTTPEGSRLVMRDTQNNTNRRLRRNSWEAALLLLPDLLPGVVAALYLMVGTALQSWLNDVTKITFRINVPPKNAVIFFFLSKEACRYINSSFKGPATQRGILALSLQACFQSKPFQIKRDRDNKYLPLHLSLPNSLA